jgi:phage tail sheath protein FI
VPTPSAAISWFEGVTGSAIDKGYAATYYPQLTIADPLQNFRPREVGVSGTMAGIYAATDINRGVWKAPAGIGAGLTGATPVYPLKDSENGNLNPLGINAIRSFAVYGVVSWGARTMAGADELADQWKYIPVRRLAQYIENSLFAGLKWAVFEPNDEPLWSSIRLNVDAFMNNLFRQGAFQGSSPKDAYFIQCDATTTTQYNIDCGIVNIIVGFAPLLPAEFVIIQIEQIAGQSAS